MSSNIKLPSPMTRDQLRELLRAGCPDLDLHDFGPGLTASSSRWAGAAVIAQGQRLSVMPMVRDLGTLALTLLMALTGVGLLIYAVVAIPRQKQVAARVEALLRRELAGAVR